MTEATLERPPNTRRNGDRLDGPGGTMGPRKAIIISVAIVALLLSGFARHVAMDQRRKTASAFGAGGQGTASLSAMNSYALALLLGGLRGPLVMFLWPSSEMQKSERNLQDFDTKIEWIRLLQAEFDTVHIFQIWNKAYNISVQMANLGNKYTTILDALDYAHKVDSERPNNINMISAIAQIYFDKLGNSQEKQYYKRRIRAESLPHELRQKLSRDDPGWRRLELDPILDDQGNVLPQYLQPGRLRLTDERTGLTYDGSQLQFLPQFGPYPYGLSPFALGYNYYKRAQLLQEVGKQRHAQLSDLVVDSRPALSLKNWAEDEFRHARRQEIAAVGRKPPSDDELLDQASADVPPTAGVPTERQALAREAIFGYGLAQRLVQAAQQEYEQHTARYPTNVTLYAQHRDSLTGVARMSAADETYLKSILATDPGEADRLRKTAGEAYDAAIDAYAVVILRYYVNPQLVSELFPPGLTREAIEQRLTPTQRRQLLMLVLEAMRRGDNAENAEDVQEYMRAIGRAETRIELLGGAGPARD